ncbi:MAG: YHS domain-containing protein [Candidatus Micrarchaeota archaeon]|nr:YHS domain-containing protein [Candidatus Micrarchaeota archaeon]
MMKDPVCGMEVKESSGFRSEYRGKKYLFCSASCKQAFEKEPGRYAKG